MCVSKQTNERAVMFMGRGLGGGEILSLLCVSDVTPTFESCGAGPSHTDGPCFLSLSFSHARTHALGLFFFFFLAKNALKFGSVSE